MKGFYGHLNVYSRPAPRPAAEIVIRIGGDISLADSTDYLTGVDCRDSCTGLSFSDSFRWKRILPSTCQGSAGRTRREIL